jgi:uncharacterized Zn finger protein (UPF0148 family)
MEFKQYHKPGKICSVCKEYKLVSEYGKSKKDGIQSRCKECKNKTPRNLKRSAQRRKERWDNDLAYREREIQRARNYRKNNPEKVSQAVRNYEKRNKDKVRERSNRYYRNRKHNDLIYKLICNFRSRVSSILKNKKIQKNNHFMAHLGCDLETLKRHIESTFKPNMTWENHGTFGWHIDHIVPLSSAKSEEDIYRLSHYTNLQALWAEENLKKSNK